MAYLTGLPMFSKSLTLVSPDTTLASVQPTQLKL